MVNVKVAERIRGLMKELNLNQVQLASHIGVKQNTFSSWLSGQKEPCINSLWLLADFFQVEIDYIVGRKDY